MRHLLLSSAMLLLPVTPLLAQGFERFDLDGNGFLDDTERRAARTALAASTTEDAATEIQILEDLEDANAAAFRGEISVRALNASADASFRGGCETERRFFIRGDVADPEILNCATITTSGNLFTGDPATLSIQRDIEDGTTVGEIDIALGYRLSERVDPSDGILPEAYLAYLSADGEFSEAGNEGTVRAGVLGSYVWGQPPDTIFLASVTPFYLTDLDFEGSGYGLEFNLEPQNFQYRLNARTGSQNWNTVFLPSLELLHVDDAGTTGLDPDTDYAFLTVEAGLQFALPPADEDNPRAFPYGITGQLTHTSTVDLVSGDDFGLWNASVDFPIEDDGRVGIRLFYERGESVDSPDFSEEAGMTLFLRF